MKTSFTKKKSIAFLSILLVTGCAGTSSKIQTGNAKIVNDDYNSIARQLVSTTNGQKYFDDVKVPKDEALYDPSIGDYATSTLLNWAFGFGALAGFGFALGDEYQDYWEASNFIVFLPETETQGKTEKEIATIAFNKIYDVATPESSKYYYSSENFVNSDKYPSEQVVGEKISQYTKRFGSLPSFKRGEFKEVDGKNYFWYTGLKLSVPFISNPIDVNELNTKIKTNLPDNNGKVVAVRFVLDTTVYWATTGIAKNAAKNGGFPKGVYQYFPTYKGEENKQYPALLTDAKHAYLFIEAKNNKQYGTYKFDEFYNEFSNEFY